MWEKYSTMNHKTDQCKTNITCHIITVRLTITHKGNKASVWEDIREKESLYVVGF